ncbi:MAG: cytochrome C oxidase subunit I, partial [SAR202 cluster bacterium]|nr:cytochrome C oxidase subunit I [SAR202 cluster bacterium]
GGATYSLIQNPDVTSGALSQLIINLNEYISMGAFGMFLVQVVFVINFFYSIRHGEKVKGDNPHDSTTLEWQTPTPPPHGNFATTPEVYGEPYAYSVPGADADFIPQTEKNRPETD